jgi:hypothetical protein
LANLVAAFATDFVHKTAAHADSTEVAAYVRIAYLAWNMHAMETTNLDSAKSASVTASDATRLCIRCKQSAG